MKIGKKIREYEVIPYPTQVPPSPVKVPPEPVKVPQPA